MADRTRCAAMYERELKEFPLKPGDSFVSIRTAASLIGVSSQTIRRRGPPIVALSPGRSGVRVQDIRLRLAQINAGVTTDA